MGNWLAGLRARVQGQGPVTRQIALEEVWRHIETSLNALATSMGEEGVWLNERGLTQRLVTLLESSQNHPYFFQKEFMEDDTDGNSRAVDIAVQVRATGARILALEAKRLPSPGSGRQMEYLTGRLGGVERFKRGLHGAELGEAGMIGYVQEGSLVSWAHTLNAWISSFVETPGGDISWDAQDLLTMEASTDRQARLHSHPLRATDGRRVALRHLWVRLHLNSF